VGLASAVVAAAVLTALYRASRGKNGVTSNGQRFQIRCKMV